MALKIHHLLSSFEKYTRCPLVTPPPQAFGGSRKNGPFFTFLKCFHFYPKVKENKNFFCKKKRKKMHKKSQFSVSREGVSFSNISFFTSHFNSRK